MDAERLLQTTASQRAQEHFVGLFSFRKMQTFFSTFRIMLSTCLLQCSSGCLRAISNLKRVTWKPYRSPPPPDLCCLLPCAPFVKWITICLVTQSRSIVFLCDVCPQPVSLTRNLLFIFLTSIHLDSFAVLLALSKPPSFI